MSADRQLSNPTSHPPKRAASAALLLATVLSSTASANDVLAPAAAASTLNTVVVTGSRNSTRTVANSSTPIDVISADALAATGQATLLDALQRALPSLSQIGGYQSDQESLIRGYQLRNLSPGYTLVLINGKRRNASAYVSGANGGAFPGHSWADLGLIPLSAIDHVEVLRDGASAIYGSDAVAGVINVILKTQASGGALAVESGQSYDGDGSRTSVRGNLGLPWGTTGFVNVSAENTVQQHAIRRILYPASWYNGSAGSDANKIFSSPSYRLTSAVISAGHPLGAGADFYVTLNAADRTGSAIQNYRLPSTIAALNPAALAVYPDGFSPSIESKEQQYSGTVGVKGNLSQWNYDFSATWNRDTIRTYTRDTLNFSLPYPGSPTDLYDGKVDYQQLVNNLDLRRAFDTGVFSSPLEVSIGAEYQHEQYKRLPGQPESYLGYGAASFVGYSADDAVDASRNSKAIYAGVSTNVTTRWFVDLAGRYEDHSDFGSVSTGRLSTRFDFTDAVAVRGTISNGFHAPGLGGQFYQATGNCPCGTTVVARVNSPTALALGATALKPEKATNYSLGITFAPNASFNAAVDVYQINIRNQLGQSSQIGYDSTNPNAITDNSGSPLDASQKAIIDNLLGAAGVSITPGQAYYASYITNVGSTRTRGIELTLEATQHTAIGQLRYNYAANLGRTDIRQVANVPAALQQLPNIDLLNETAEYALRYHTPRYTQLAGVHWSNGPWQLSLDASYFGPIKSINNGYKYQLAPLLVTNLGGSYDIGHGWSVDAGINNLFDERQRKRPDASRSASEKANYVFNYASVDSVGTTGGYWYGRINYRF